MRIVIVFFFLILKCSSTFISSSYTSIPLNISTHISSPKNVFELGLFNSTTAAAQRGEHLWYLGIWYKSLPHEVVWVANRKTPLSDPLGTLVIKDTNFHMFNQYGEQVWSTNVTHENGKSELLGELLDSGNLVLRYKNSTRLLWQSFDYPTDTLLPQMKMGWDKKSGLNRMLNSWRSDDDPSGGAYTYGIGTHVTPENYIMKDGKKTWRSGPWINASDLDKALLISMHNLMSVEFTVSNQEISFSFKIDNSSIISILKIGYKGILHRSTWLLTSGEPKKIDDYSLRSDSCDTYGRCGDNGFCDIDSHPPTGICGCPEGFRPVHLGTQESRFTESDCVRKIPINCYGYDFLKLQNMKLPETKAADVSMSSSFDECKKTCLEDCNCNSFAYENMTNGKLVCIIWTHPLQDMRKNQVAAGQELYVRMKMIETELHSAGVELRHSAEMELETIAMATDGFSDSNKIGQGGFGTVYKGRLVDGREIAVKRLSKKSNDGIDGFKNELRHIVKVQHANLVQLYGYCFSGDEMLLIYEYLVNSSLDTFIFDASQSFKLNWEKRVDIIVGVGRGLLYLHQDSRYPIIHRDLKPGNILLDKDMIPKISDFGMAKSFVKGAETETTAIVGTYGYMPNEYAEKGICSTKSDVHSFGIVLFEILCGKKNSQFLISENEYLLHLIWKHWQNATWIDILDPVLLQSSTFRPREAARLIQIGFLCVQPNPDDRPTMSSVLVMLTTINLEIPQPNPPPFFVPPRPVHTGSSSTERSWTLAQYSISAIQGRT